MRRSIVSVIGDAGVQREDARYIAAFEVGRRLVDSGFRVMTGGLGGVMEAASRGAHASARYREGDTVGMLPSFDPSLANAWVDVAIATGMDHQRNGLVANADAVIAVGGGAGTLAEITFAWLYKRLVIALRGSGWAGELADRRLDARRRVDLDDDRIHGADGPEEAVALVVARLPEYAARHQGFRPA